MGQKWNRKEVCDLLWKTVRLFNTGLQNIAVLSFAETVCLPGSIKYGTAELILI
jgi:hypothetical protein